MRTLIMRLVLATAVGIVLLGDPHAIAQPAKPYVYRDCGDPGNKFRPECATKKPAAAPAAGPAVAKNAGGAAAAKNATHHVMRRRWHFLSCDDYALNSAERVRCFTRHGGGR